jgi:hypothetical protein
MMVKVILVKFASDEKRVLTKTNSRRKIRFTIVLLMVSLF